MLSALAICFTFGCGFVLAASRATQLPPVVPGALLPSAPEPAGSPPHPFVDGQMRGLEHRAKFGMILYPGAFGESAAPRLDAFALGVNVTGR